MKHECLKFTVVLFASLTAICLFIALITCVKNVFLVLNSSSYSHDVVCLSTVKWYQEGKGWRRQKEESHPEVHRQASKHFSIQ